jgi:hypothetical protein
MIEKMVFDDEINFLKLNVHQIFLDLMRINSEKFFSKQEPGLKKLGSAHV